MGATQAREKGRITAAARVARILEVVTSDGWRGTAEDARGVYTDGCAEVLLLEAERLRAERRLTAALADAAADETAAAHVREHNQRLAELSEELGSLRGALEQLRSAVLPLPDRA